VPTNWKVNPPGRFVCKQGLIKGLSTIGFQVVGGLKVVSGGFKYFLMFKPVCGNAPI